MTIVRTDNLLYFAVYRFASEFRVCDELRNAVFFVATMKITMSRNSGLLEVLALSRNPVELSAHSDLLFTPKSVSFLFLHISVLKWRTGMVRAAVALFFLSHFLWKGKRRKTIVLKKRRRYFITGETKRGERERERDSASTNVTHVFFFL